MDMKMKSRFSMSWTMASALTSFIMTVFLVYSISWMQTPKAQALGLLSLRELSRFTEAGSGSRAKREKGRHFFLRSRPNPHPDSCYKWRYLTHGGLFYEACSQYQHRLVQKK